MMVLQRYLLAIGEHDAELRALAAEAAHICGAPVALLGFLGTDRETIKAAVGWKVDELPLMSSFAAHFADARDVVVVSDAVNDDRFRAHPFVGGTPNIRFIAGAPLIDSSGLFLGALTILDRAPHQLQPIQVQVLRMLARQVVHIIESRSDRINHNQEVSHLRESLEESEGRFRDLFEQTDDLIMSIAADGRLLHANQATLNALGLTNEELSQTAISRVIDADERENFRRTWERVFAKGEPQRIETVFVAAGGRRITVEGALRPRVIDGCAVMARVIFRDVTDRKQFETDLANARDGALEAARLKTQFLANVSHEIRTPMNGIIGMLDLMLGTPLTTEQADFAHQGKASAEQLLSIVNNILYISNIEAGRLATANADFDLYRLLERVVEVMKIGAVGKDIAISFSYDEKLPLIVYGNQPRVRQIVSNLMENAVKFTMQGSRVPADGNRDARRHPLRDQRYGHRHLGRRPPAALRALLAGGGIEHAPLPGRRPRARRGAATHRDDGGRHRRREHAGNRIDVLVLDPLRAAGRRPETDRLVRPRVQGEARRPGRSHADHPPNRAALPRRAVGDARRCRRVGGGDARTSAARSEIGRSDPHRDL
jgi:PAS domain S-box-containing protein